MLLLITLPQPISPTLSQSPQSPATAPYSAPRDSGLDSELGYTISLESKSSRSRIQPLSSVSRGCNHKPRPCLQPAVMGQTGWGGHMCLPTAPVSARLDSPPDTHASQALLDMQSWQAAWEHSSPRSRLPLSALSRQQGHSPGTCSVAWKLCRVSLSHALSQQRPGAGMLPCLGLA